MKVIPIVEQASIKPEAYAVIGLNFGDEGKGQTVYTVSEELAKQGGQIIVVKNNGGAQAGHTVTKMIGIGETRKPVRFIHSQTGSNQAFGEENNSTVILGDKFFFNPRNFLREYDKLMEVRTTNGFNHPIKFFINAKCQVTLTADIRHGRKREEELQHGSCGEGIFSTFSRVNHGASMTVSEMSSQSYPQQMEKVAKFYSDDVFHDETETVLAMQRVLTLDGVFVYHELNDVLKHFGKEKVTFVYEGAQGLELDMHNVGNFPNLTPSCTGVENFLDFLPESVDTLNVFFATRPYVSKHGAGGIWSNGTELSAQLEQMVNDNFIIIDETNVPNRWQGALKFAPIAIANRAKFLRTPHEKILKQLQVVESSGKICRSGLAVTCLDQWRDVKSSAILHTEIGNLTEDEVFERLPMLHSIKKILIE